MTSSEPPVQQPVQAGDVVWVFVNQAGPTTLLNFQLTGTFVSPVVSALEDSAFLAAYQAGTADFLPFVPNPEATTGFLSPFTLNTVRQYTVEYDAELSRRAVAPGAPSRLSAVFAFESEDVCRQASSRYGWPLAEATPFVVQANLRSCRVNMELVTLFRDAYVAGTLSAQQKHAMWRAYWSGQQSFEMQMPLPDGTGHRRRSSGFLPELLIDGVLKRADRS